jgi:hypothetical protein
MNTADGYDVDAALRDGVASSTLARAEAESLDRDG